MSNTPPRRLTTRSNDPLDVGVTPMLGRRFNCRPNVELPA